MAAILVIDDDPGLRGMVRRMLERAGHEVVEAENGRVGLEAAAARTFDVLVTDIIMPEMEGIETIIAIRARQPDLPIVAMSGGASSRHTDFLRMAAHFGAGQILQKPFTMNELLAAIAHAIASQGAENGGTR